MDTATPQTAKPLSILIVAVCVLLACLGLGYIDHETHSIADLFKPGNLAALVVYFVPTFLICYLIYRLLIRKYETSKSISLSLIIGIPSGFTLVIVALLLLRMFR